MTTNDKHILTADIFEAQLDALGPLATPGEYSALLAIAPEDAPSLSWARQKAASVGHHTGTAPFPSWPEPRRQKSRTRRDEPPAKSGTPDPASSLRV